MNVDHSEVNKFEELASRWWDPNSEFAPLHEINPLRADWIDSHANVAGKTLLDVGCGGGILSEAMAVRGAQVTGLDMGEKPLKVAKLHALESQLDINYIQKPVEALAEEQPASFDVVTCMEMLEHVPDPASVVAACAKLCKPGGHLFFSTINRNPKSYAFAILGAEYVLRLLPRGTHDWQKFIKPAELGHAIRSADLLIGESKGMTYNPISKAYKLVDHDVDVNYMMAARKPD